MEWLSGTGRAILIQYMNVMVQSTVNQCLYLKTQWKLPTSNIEGQEVAALPAEVEGSRQVSHTF